MDDGLALPLNYATRALTFVTALGILGWALISLPGVVWLLSVLPAAGLQKSAAWRLALYKEVPTVLAGFLIWVTFRRQGHRRNKVWVQCGRIAACAILLAMVFGVQGWVRAAYVRPDLMRLGSMPYDVYGFPSAAALILLFTLRHQ